MKPLFKSYWLLPTFARCNAASASSSATDEEEYNQQVGVSGSGAGATIGTGAGSSNVINITSSDPDVLEAALSTVGTVATGAINEEATTGLESENIAASEIENIGDTDAQAEELALEQSANATQTAQDIAANAAPQTIAAQEELQSGVTPTGEDVTGSISMSTVLIILAVAGFFLTLFLKNRKL